MALYKAKIITLLKKARNILKSITVEPILWGFLISSVLAMTAIQNLNLEKACRVNLGYSKDFCIKLINQEIHNNTVNDDIQKLVSSMNSLRLPISFGIPCILVLFAGTWSDKTMKRKMFMLLPIVGQIINVVAEFFITYYFLVPLEMSSVIESVPSSIFGGFQMISMATFSYMADNTSEDERSFRMGILNAFMIVAAPLAMSGGGFILKYSGYYGVFTICGVVIVLTLFYTMFRIKDNAKAPAETSNHKAKGYFDAFEILTKKREMKKRLRLWLLFLIHIFYTGPYQGAFSLNYLFARTKHQFTEVDFSIFSLYVAFFDIGGMIFSIFILINKFHLDDNILGAMAITSKIFGSLMYCLAPNKSWYYVAPILDIMNSAINISFRSIGSKLVESDEIGKMNSVYGVLDGVVGMVFTFIFPQIYSYTVSTFPGAYYLIQVAVIFPCLPIFLYLYRLQKQQDELSKKHENGKMELPEITS